LKHAFEAGSTVQPWLRLPQRNSKSCLEKREMPIWASRQVGLWEVEGRTADRRRKQQDNPPSAGITPTPDLAGATLAFEKQMLVDDSSLPSQTHGISSLRKCRETGSLKSPARFADFDLRTPAKSDSLRARTDSFVRKETRRKINHKNNGWESSSSLPVCPKTPILAQKLRHQPQLLGKARGGVLTSKQSLQTGSRPGKPARKKARKKK
jgi:hypothetical protein